MKRGLILFIIVGVLFLSSVSSTTIDIREECRSDPVMSNLYPIRISIDVNNRNHYIGYNTWWRWYEYTSDHWTAEYGGTLYEMNSFDKGLTWSCPQKIKNIPEQGIEIGASYSSNNLGKIMKFLPINYPTYGEFSSCGWYDEYGNEQMCSYSNAGGRGVIYPTDENWNLLDNPLIGYDENSENQKQFLINNGYNYEDRRYDLIYYPNPIKISGNRMHLYFGGWKGENSASLFACLKQYADYPDSVVTNGANYKYCNCYKSWEEQSAGWWDETPYDLCTGDKIYYATNQFSSNPYDFRSYTGNALDKDDNSIAGSFSGWASEEWQPVLWTQGVKESCQHSFCLNYFDDATATNDFTVVKLPSGKFVAYWTTGFKNEDIFPETNGIGHHEGGIMLVAQSNNPYHFLSDENLQPLVVDNWNKGNLQGNLNNYVFDGGIHIPSAVYDEELGKIVLFLHYWDRNKNQGSIPFYRVLIDPSNPYVAESITLIDSIKTIPTCTSHTYSPWTICNSSALQTRTILSSSPENCKGGNPLTIQQCSPLCLESNWQATNSSCSSSGILTRTWTKIGNCNSSIGINKPTTETLSCTYNHDIVICTNFIYSNWSECFSNGIKNRSLIVSYPENCENGSPILSMYCNYTTNIPDNQDSNGNEGKEENKNNEDLDNTSGESEEGTDSQIQNNSETINLNKKSTNPLKSFFIKLICKISNLFNEEGGLRGC